MTKTRLEKPAFLYPMPMTIVGSEVDNNANFMAVAWVTPVNYNPLMIGIALGKMHHTNKGIREHGQFSINIPGIDLLQEADYVGLVSGAKTDKSKLFELFKGELAHAPMIENCPITLECEVEKTIDLPSNEFFIGRVVGAYGNEDVLTEGVADIEKIKPFSLTMPDNRYWSVGEQVGKAWKDGLSLKEG